MKLFIWLRMLAKSGIIIQARNFPYNLQNAHNAPHFCRVAKEVSHINLKKNPVV